MLFMNASIADLYRLLENLIRLGTVLEVNGDFARIKSGKLESNWLRWLNLRAGNVKTWCQPSIGEQAIVFSPGGDTAAALILVGIYSDENPAPSNDPNLHTTHYPDGAVVEYDHAVHAMRAILPAGSSATITANVITANADSVTSNAPQTTCTGNLTVAKNLIVNGSSALNGGMAVQAGADGPAATINGSLHATEDVTASGISLASHRHGGVQIGGSITETPQ